MCFTDLYTANRLNGWQEDQFSGAEMLVSNFSQIDEVEHQVVKRVNRTTDHYGETYSSATVTEMNPQIFSWLELMDLNVWLILGLMIAVAIVTMVSGLLIIIPGAHADDRRAQGPREPKTSKCATSSCGLPPLCWSRACFGATPWAQASSPSSTSRVSCASIPRPTTSARSPSRSPDLSSLALNVATLLVCVAALVVPSFLVSRIHPAKSMHYE